MQIRIYKPAGQSNGILAETKAMFFDLRASRDLAKRLTIRDFKAQYRQSALGVLWAFITPLLNTVVWVFLQKTGVVQMADTGIPYPAFVFSGTMLWAILTESLNAPLLSTQQSKSIMGKINFPKEALILSGFYKTTGNAAIRLLLVFAAIIAMGVIPGIHLLFLPFFVIAMIFTGFTLGMLITPVGMLYQDVGRAVPLLMQFLMYLSPVIYAAPQSGSLAKIIQYNPLSVILVNARNCFTGEPFQMLPYFFVFMTLITVLFFAGWFFYRFSIPIIVERSAS